MKKFRLALAGILPAMLLLLVGIGIAVLCLPAQAADPTDTFYGTDAGLLTFGIEDSGFGYNALFSNTEGSYNTANGAHALYSNKGSIIQATGFYNTASGAFALYSNTTGSYNTANGAHALYYNTDGKYNTASGAVSLYSNTTGSQNTATGLGALYFNTVGFYNTASGVHALSYNTTG